MNYTKEELKKIAEVEESSSFDDSTSEEDLGIVNCQRKINLRPEIKVIFAGLILLPLLFLVSIFQSKSSGQAGVNNQTESINAKITDLQRQLKASKKREEELDGRLAVVKQENLRLEKERQKTQATASKAPSSKTADKTTKPQLKPQTISHPISQPRAIVKKPSPSKATLDNSERLLDLTASVYGSGMIEDTLSKDEKSLESNQDREGVLLVNNQKERQRTKPDLVDSDINSDLEAPFLLEQKMLTLVSGTRIKAVLAVPWIETEEETLVSVVLEEPLKSKDGTIFLPSKTTILVNAEIKRKDSRIVNFIAVEAHLPSSNSRPKVIELPEGIRLTAEDGKPILAKPIEEGDEEANFFSWLDSADRVRQRVGGGYNRATSDRALESQRVIRQQIENRQAREHNRSQLYYLPAETPLEMYISQDALVPDHSQELLEELDSEESKNLPRSDRSLVKEGAEN